MGGERTQLIPAAHSEGFTRVFAWYTRRLLAKRFEQVRLALGSRAIGAELNDDERPLVLVLNHSSWWDPLVAFHVARTLLPSRTGIAPMDREQLERFRFFRKIGLFGITPDDAASMRSMQEYVRSFFGSSPRPSLALTPQGRFADVREPLVLRPGAAAVCAQFSPGTLRVGVLAIEYAFWQSQRPEVFLHLSSVDAPVIHSTSAWQRRLTEAMEGSMRSLAAQVILRDPGGFESLVDRRGASVNPAYDLLLRLRGRQGEIAARRSNIVQTDRPLAERTTA